MAKASEHERVAHVVRRLSMGPGPDLIGTVRGTDGAIAAALDLSSPAPQPLAVEPPASLEQAREFAQIVPPITWWFEQMRSSSRRIEERLVWFWHDHFATSIAKVRVPYLMWQQHLTIRHHATGSFGDLLRAMAKDPAMLVWLDGVANTAAQRNENFGREVMELFTLGHGGGYTQRDVVEASRSFTGWVVNVPGRAKQPAVAAALARYPTWSAVFVPQRHDDQPKRLLGKTDDFDMDGALTVLLEHPSTARFVATKLYRELVGLDPGSSTVERLAAAFRRDYSVMALVEAVVSDPAFTSDAAVRAKVRNPVEKLVGLLQAAAGSTLRVGRVAKQPRVQAGGGAVAQALRTLGFVPFMPPNVGGFPKGPSLLGPHQLVHTFDLLAAIDGAPPEHAPDELFARLGLFDVSARSRSLVAKQSDPARRFALAVASPEYQLV